MVKLLNTQDVNLICPFIRSILIAPSISFTSGVDSITSLILIRAASACSSPFREEASRCSRLFLTSLFISPIFTAGITAARARARNRKVKKILLNSFFKGRSRIFLWISLLNYNHTDGNDNCYGCK